MLGAAVTDPFTTDAAEGPTASGGPGVEVRCGSGTATFALVQRVGRNKCVRMCKPENVCLCRCACPAYAYESAAVFSLFRPA